MGLNTVGGEELAPLVLSGSFTGTGQSTAVVLYGPANFTLSGTFAATVQVERSFDGGSTYIAMSIDTSGTPASYTAAVSTVVNEPEPGVFYRFNCTAYTSGTVNYRLAGGPRLT